MTGGNDRMDNDDGPLFRRLVIPVNYNTKTALQSPEWRTAVNLATYVLGKLLTIIMQEALFQRNIQRCPGRPRTTPEASIRLSRG